jgi:phage shock protein B
MENLFLPMVLVFLTIVVPLWLLLHYITQWRRVRGLSKEDEQLLEDLWENSARMEERMQALEEILDSDAPGWRKEARDKGE